MTKPKRPQPGDIYAGRLLDERYGAVRVIRTFPRSLWLMCTQYIGAEPPSIDDPALKKLVRRKRATAEPGPALSVVNRPLPDSFVLVGNRPVTALEQKLDPKGNFQQWSVLNEVLHEWRWEHDREAVERERKARRDAAERERAAPPRKRTRTPNSTLTEAQFWALIGTQLELKPLKAALRKRGRADTQEFRELLAHKLFLLDGKAYADRAGAAGNSADAFLYARCAVVARGRAFYRSVLAHPEKFPADADGEDLLSVMSEDADTHYDVETGANAAGWA